MNLSIKGSERVPYSRGFTIHYNCLDEITDDVKAVEYQGDIAVLIAETSPAILATQFDEILWSHRGGLASEAQLRKQLAGTNRTTKLDLANAIHWHVQNFDS
jgi:hypothetical protein